MSKTLIERRDALISEAKAIATEAKAAARELTEDEVTLVNEKAAQIEDLNEKIKAASKANALIDSFNVTDAQRLRDTHAAKSIGEHFVKNIDLTSIKSVMGSQASALAAPEFKAASDVHTVPTAPARLILPDIDKKYVLPFHDRAWVSDWLAAGTISSNALTYFVERATGGLEGDFETVAENAAIPQLHFGGYDEVTETLRKVAGYIKVSKEMIDDADFLVSEINARLLRQLAIVEEKKLLTGSGANDIVGLLNRSGVQALQAPTQAALLDTIYSAIIKIESVTGMVPDAIVIHPTDYEKVRLSKDANGQYLAGGPFFGSYGSDSLVLDPPLWGTQIIKTSAIPVGTILVGSSQAATVYRKGGIEVETAFENENDFLFDRVAIRAKERLALAVRVPAAFAKVTVKAA